MSEVEEFIRAIRAIRVIREPHHSRPSPLTLVPRPSIKSIRTLMSQTANPMAENLMQHYF